MTRAPHWYRSAALQLWPTAEIVSFGRWALVAKRDGVVKCVYLFADREQAAKSMAFCDSRIYDLDPPVPEIADDWEDRARERRERKQREEA